MGPTPFAGLRVAVTGGTSGLGLALVDLLHREGAAVAFVARGRDRVDEVARNHAGVHGIVGDVASKDDIYPMALQILGELGGLDILINNASDLGPTPLALLGDTDCEDLERAIDTNVVGPFRLTKALLGALAASAREGRGAVVLNISSDAAVTAYPTWGALRREQGGTASSHSNLGHRTGRGGHSIPLDRSGRHGHTDACGSRTRCGSLDAEAANSCRA